MSIKEAPLLSKSHDSPRLHNYLNGHQIWILSEFGKPIFSSFGREDELCSTFAVIQVFVKRYETWKDSLASIQMPNLCIQFMYRSPLILCLVSRASYNLTMQLEAVYNQVISILSKSMLKSIYGKMGDNFDLRRWLDGIDKRVESCVKGFNEDPVVSALSGFRILPLDMVDREFLVQTMATAINTKCPNNIVFAVLVAHRQLVAMVRMNQLDLSASDYHIIVNIMECHKSLRNNESWVPICLPQFDQSSFLYAHISYLWEGMGPCLVLFSLSKDEDAFFGCASVRQQIEEQMCSYKRHLRLKEALTHPDAFSLKQLSCVELWHFMYKNVENSQVCCSSPQKPYIAYDELISLYHHGYFKLTDMLRRTKVNGGSGSGGRKNVKMLFISDETSTLFAWVTLNYELYCTFSPLVNQACVIRTANQILRVLRDKEKRVFFGVSPGILNSADQ